VDAIVQDGQRMAEQCLQQIFSLLDRPRTGPADLAIACTHHPALSCFTAPSPVLREGLPVFPARFGFSFVQADVEHEK
jgi:xanthine dehydrogenase molybdopterin-binding subunit B